MSNEADFGCSSWLWWSCLLASFCLPLFFFLINFSLCSKRGNIWHHSVIVVHGESCVVHRNGVLFSLVLCDPMLPSAILFVWINKYLLKKCNTKAAPASLSSFLNETSSKSSTSFVHKSLFNNPLSVTALELVLCCCSATNYPAWVIGSSAEGLGIHPGHQC